MDLFKSYATDLAAEENGRWFENGDVEYCIARSGNRKYSDMIQAQLIAHKHTLDQKDTEEARAAGNDRAEKIQTLVMSRAILLGWRGLPKKDPTGKVIEDGGQPVLGKVMYNGEEFPFSQANAGKALALKDFRNWVSTKADDFHNYLLTVKKDDEKNSEPTSTGS